MHSPRVHQQPRRHTAGEVTWMAGLWLVAALLLGGSAEVAAERLSEYQVKAAFLGKFAYYVEWPKEAFATDDAPLIIGILGRDPFGEQLDQLTENATVGGHPLQLERFARVEEVEACHILFISRSEKRRLSAILEAVGSGVLTVSELEWFAQSGGMIRLGIEAERIRFEINPEAARRAGLKISSRLLKLARIVTANSDV